MWLWLVFVIQIWFVWTVLWLHSWNRISEQCFTTLSVSGIFQRLWDSSDLVSNDQIVAMAAENSSVNTVWFLYVIDIKCVDHLSNNTDEQIQSKWP